MWLLNVAWKTDSDKLRTESNQSLKFARRYPLETSSQLIISRNTKSRGTALVPNFVIPVKNISGKNGILNVGPFDPSSDPNDPTTRPTLELQCNKEKGIDIAQGRLQPDGQKWKVRDVDLIADLKRDGYQEDFLMDMSRIAEPNVQLADGETQRLEDGDILILSAAVFAVSGIYFTWNKKDTPKGYNYYSTDRINLAFGPLQAAVNQCHFVKPQFAEDLLQHVDEVHANNRQLVTEIEVVKEKETVVGVDMRYKPFRIPEIKDGRSHDNPDEFDETVGKDLKQQVLTDRIRNGMFRGVTLLFFVIEPIAEKTLQAAQGFARLAEELGAQVVIHRTGKLSGVQEGKNLLQTIQKEAFDNFQKARKKGKVLIGSEPDCLILLPLASDPRPEAATYTAHYVMGAASELGMHDLDVTTPLQILFRAIASMDLSLLRVSSNTRLNQAERGEEIAPTGATGPAPAPSTATTSLPPTRRTHRSEPTPTPNDAPTQDEPMEEIPPTNPQPPPTVAPTPLRRRTRTNKVDDGLDPADGEVSRKSSENGEDPPPAPTRTSPLKRRSRNAGVTALFMGSSEETAAKGGGTSNADLRAPSQTQSLAHKLLAAEEERERREALGESVENESMESDQGATAAKKRLKTSHEVSKKSNLGTVGEDDSEMDVDQRAEPQSRRGQATSGKNKRRADDDCADEEDAEMDRCQAEPSSKQHFTSASRKRRETGEKNPNNPAKTGLTIEATRNKGNEDGTNLDEDAGFLEALKSRAKTNRSVVDDFDKDFNKMRISKSKLNELNKVEIDEEYEAWKKMTTDELEAFQTQTGNFIKVDKVPLVRDRREQGTRADGSHYQDGVLKGEWKLEWNGRINHKKFKKVERVQRVPLQMTLSEVHDYGLGPGYGSKPKATASEDDGLDRSNLEEADSPASDQEHLSIAATSKTARKNPAGRVTQTASTQGKRKGTLKLDWSEESASDDDQDESLGSTAANKAKGKGKAGKAQTAAQKRRAAAEAEKAKSKGGKGKKRGVVDSDKDELLSDSDQDEEPELNLDLDISDSDADDFSFAKSGARKSSHRAPATRNTAATSRSTKATGSGPTSRLRTKSPTPTNKISASSTLKASMSLDDTQSVSRPGGSKAKTGEKRNIETVEIDDSGDDGDGDFAGFGRGSRTKKRR